MSLEARIESLEDQFFAPHKAMSWSDFEFVYFLNVRYGKGNVEKNISGTKLYKYRLLTTRFPEYFQKPEPRPPGSMLFPERVPKEKKA